MKRLRRYFPHLVLTAAIGFTTSGFGTARSAALQLSSDECRVTVSGREKPEQLLAQEVWESTFRRLSASPPSGLLAGMPGPKVARLAAAGSSAVIRAAALRQSLQSAPTIGLRQRFSQDRELIIADSILDARDNELRGLSSDEFERLTDYALETASTTDVTLPIPGRIVADDFGGRYCEVVARGSEHPQLVVEHQVWRLMFRNLSRVIELATERLGGIPDDEFVRELRMPIDDVRVFVRIAKDTVAKEAQLRAALNGAGAEPSAEQSKQLESDLQRLVMSARYSILRSIDVASWRGLMTHVDRVRANTTSRYGSPLQ